MPRRLPREPPRLRPGEPLSRHPGRAPQQESRQPLEFEELARFASSVVMLKIFDQNHQCFKSGSGVIINDQGYVLTNLHVVNGGHYYGILLEEETDIFYTNELIKYHQDYDLAVVTTAHSCVDYELVAEAGIPVFDCKNVMKAVQNRGNIEVL